jgi:DNA-cytosine methyltransferase
VDTTKTITHLSLCSGYEGIGLGLRKVLPTLREIACVEIELYAIYNLVKKMEQGFLHEAPIYTDVKTFPYEQFCGKVDIMSFGFPCQPFSVAGSREGTKDPRHLFPYIAKGIRECRPKLLFAENVPGIITSKTKEGESVLKYVMRTMERLGYRTTAGIFSASEIGAPHLRKRIFILGIRKELGNAKGECSRLNKTKQKGGNTFSRSSQELGYSERNGHVAIKKSRGVNKTSNHKSEGQKSSIELEGTSGRGVSTDIQGCNELPNSKDIGCRGRSDRDRDDKQRVSEQASQEQPILWSETERCGRVMQYPARPNEPQHDWEEPRVVGDTESKQSTPKDNKGESRSTSESKQIKPRRGHSGTLRGGNGQAKSRLGRTANGATRRMDSNRLNRLRLLGNGVVPDCAAKAFVVLFNRLMCNNTE